MGGVSTRQTRRSSYAQAIAQPAPPPMPSAPVTLPTRSKPIFRRPDTSPRYSTQPVKPDWTELMARRLGNKGAY